MSEGTWEKLSQVAVKGAEHDSCERRPHAKCLEETRVVLLNYIYGLLDNREKNRLIWLHGTAGVGKSAVAFTVAERMRGLKMTEETKIEKRLGGTFFFSRKHTRRRTTGYFFVTLAYQLAINFPSVQTDVNRAILKNPALLDPHKSLRDQMEALFLQPLRKLQSRLPECPPLAFVIDALDECTPESLDESPSESELADLISLLGEALRKPDLPVIHILLTSRLEEHIRKAMQAEEMRPLVFEIPVKTSGEGVAATISLDGADVDNDIYIFLKHSFRNLESRHPDFPQLSMDQLTRLASRAGRRFIVASTMVKFIDDRSNDPRDRLQLMLELTSELLPGTEVYKLYDHILSTCADPTLAYLHLSVVAALADPLPISQISKLLGPSQGGDLERVLVQLRSIIDIPSDSSLPVKIYHSSVRDYVSHRSNCSLHQVQYITSPHSLLAHSSLRLMMQDLPDSSALLDALSALKKQNQAMEPHDPQSLTQSLSFIVQPPEPMQVLITLLWHRGNRNSELQFWLETLDGRAWLQTQGGKGWLLAQGGKDWLLAQGGRAWLLAQGGKDWLQTQGGKDWLQTQEGNDWLETHGGHDWLQTRRWHDRLQTLRGQDWLQTYGGQDWLQTHSGQEWLQTRGGQDWLQTQRGQIWLQTHSGQQTQRGQNLQQTHSSHDRLQTLDGQNWLQTQRGQDWLQTRRGQDWLQTQPGQNWLQIQPGQNWLQTQGGKDWLQIQPGKDWLRTYGGHDWLDTRGGQEWLQNQRGQDWLQTHGGQDWLDTHGGQNWLQTQRWKNLLQTLSGHDWLQTQPGKDWLRIQPGRDWLQTQRGQNWLQTLCGHDWLQTQPGKDWLHTQRGQKWLQTLGGHDWLQTQPGRNWLQTQGGHDWLQTPSAQDWLQTSDARDWLQTPDGRDWLQTSHGQMWRLTSVWVTMEEFSNTLEAIKQLIIVPELSSQPAFQVLQQFKSLPDFLMFPAFLALRHQVHSTSALTQGPFPPDIEIIHAMKAFSNFANKARERSQSAPDVLNYACQNWAAHISRAPNPWDEKLVHMFKSFWDRHLLNWLERQWCVKDLQSCLNILSEGEKLVKEHLLPIRGSSQ